MVEITRARASAYRRDRLTAALIRLAAFAVLGFTFLLLVYLSLEVWPLARKARVQKESELREGEALATWPADQPGTFWQLLPSGAIRLWPEGSQVSLPQMVPPIHWLALDRWGGALALADGEGLKVYRLQTRWLWRDQERVQTLRPQLLEMLPQQSGRLLAFEAASPAVGVYVREGATYLFRQGSVTKLLETQASLAALAGSSPQVWLATTDELYVFDGDKLVASVPLPASPTAISLLLGDLTCLVGDASGNVKAYNLYREGGTSLLEAFATFPGEGPVLALASSPRNKAFAVVRPGWLEIDYLTSRRRLAKTAVARGQELRVFFSPRGDRVLVTGDQGSGESFQLKLGHPEVTLATLFGKVRYEGQREASWSWQSTGGSNAFESKLSLLPLIFGSLKGAAYAMLFSAPLAFMAALYTSQFASQRLRRLVKPLVELMAGVPSVVVGFVAALVFAPWLAKNLEAVLLAFFLLPLALLLAGKLCELRPRWWQLRLQRRGELALAAALAVGSVVLAGKLGPLLGKTLFGGSLVEFLQTRWGAPYDQRNAIVAGVALGFAVLPVIFTLAEEALSNVPENLVYAALSLGASRAKAAWTVVVPGAAPGLVAAVLLGFGRAAGETMIVLMASGNAPLLSFSPLVGMRTMAACIAVELPEAAYGDSLYRVLLLLALLLFAFTFLINLVGQKVSSALKRRFGVSA
ncbi:MAG: ABC transporter permease subunit [Thermoanaerobaculaceae bacterium]